MPIASVAIAYTNHVHNYAGGYHSAKMFLMVEWVTLFSHDVPTDLGHQPDAPPGVAKHDLNVRPSKFFSRKQFRKRDYYCRSESYPSIPCLPCCNRACQLLKYPAALRHTNTLSDRDVGRGSIDV